MSNIKTEPQTTKTYAKDNVRFVSQGCMTTIIYDGKVIGERHVNYFRKIVENYDESRRVYQQKKREERGEA